MIRHPHEPLVLQTWSGSRGFSLLEAMVAAGILSVGLLGLAGMQAMSLGKNVDANEITRVSNLATDMMERIQNNRQRVMEYVGINTTTNCSVTGFADGVPLGSGNIVPVGPVALGDCNQWKDAVQNSGLENAVGVVTINRIDPSVTVNPQTMQRVSVTVSLFWTAHRSDVSTQRLKTANFRSIIAPE